MNLWLPCIGGRPGYLHEDLLRIVNPVEEVAKSEPSVPERDRGAASHFPGTSEPT